MKSDPIILAARALSQAMEDAQRAVDIARTRPSPDTIALAACRKESEALQAKNSTLVASSRTHLREINRLQMRCNALVADLELSRFDLRALTTREKALIAERNALDLERATLEKELDRARAYRRSTVVTLKRSVGFLQAEIAQQSYGIVDIEGQSRSALQLYCKLSQEGPILKVQSAGKPTG